MYIQVKLDEGAVLPKKANQSDAGYDVVAISDPIITDSYIEYKTGLRIQPDIGYHVLIHPRSSISKYNLVLCNGIGLIDNQYRGELLVRFKYIPQKNDITVDAKYLEGEEDCDPSYSVSVNIDFNKIYKKGDRICQLVVEKTVDSIFTVVNELDDTTRGEGGFGSTGK